MSSLSVPLEWRPSSHARRLTTLSAFALLLGLGLGRPMVVSLAAVPIAFLCRSRQQLPAAAELTVETGQATSFEGEPVTLTVSVKLPSPVELADVLIRPGQFIEPTTRRRATAQTAQTELHDVIRIGRWGRRRLGLTAITLVAEGGLARATINGNLGEVATFPRPVPVGRPVVTPLRGGLAGDHRGRRSGSGTEFAGIRQYGAGDSPGQVNWPVSLRLQRLHVTQRRADDAVEVVLVVDACTDIGSSGISSLDLSVRGATGLARELLRHHDRVGVVAVGGWLRWLGPDTGSAQFYRVAEAMLDVVGRESFVDPDVELLPARAVPSGAHVVMFSPLVDPRALRVVEQLRMRGVQVTVVDVLNGVPVAHDATEWLAARLWRLTRESETERLARLGVLTVAWDGIAPLEGVLRYALSSRWALR